MCEFAKASDWRLVQLDMPLPALLSANSNHSRRPNAALRQGTISTRDRGMITREFGSISVVERPAADRISVSSPMAPCFPLLVLAQILSFHFVFEV